jgi:tRNA uridine 5-carboxymethylaminomethyl modification enzyme
LGVEVSADGRIRDGMAVLALPGARVESLLPLDPSLGEIAEPVRRLIETEAQYSVYLERQRSEIVRVERDERIAIPESFDYATLKGLSAEALEKLIRFRPANLAAARAIEGVTPAALVLLAAALRRHRDAKPEDDAPRGAIAAAG